MIAEKIGLITPDERIYEDIPFQQNRAERRLENVLENRNIWHTIVILTKTRCSKKRNK